MKGFIKIVSVALFLIVVLFISLFVFVRTYGKEIIERHAAAMLGQPVSIVEVGLALPLVVEIKGLNVEGLLWADEAEVRCDLTTFAGKSFDLSQVKLINPVLTLHRGRDNQILWTPDHDGKAQETASAGPLNNGKPDQPKVNASIHSLLVENGQISFPRHSGDEGFEISFHSVQLTASNVPLSGQGMDAGFNFSGIIAGDGVPFSGDHLKGSGWINWPARNMDAVFKVTSPRGHTGLEVNLNSKNNDMMVRGHVDTRRMNLKAQDADDDAQNLLMNAIQSAGMAVDMDFSFPIKMDRWELRNIDFSGNLSASDDGKTAPEKVEDLKNIGQQFKAVGEQIYEKYKPSGQ